MIEKIVNSNKLYAIIVYSDHHNDGVDFFTPDDFSQQLAYISHKKGKIIEPHVHIPYKRKITYTQEVLIIKSGMLKVDFYDDDRKYFGSRVLEKGDIILLASGGHGFEVLQDVQMIEVKQGPYCREKDKIRFSALKQDEQKRHDV